MNKNSIINVGVENSGVFYNSYLLCFEKTVLIDTVPLKFSDELCMNIQKNGVNKLDYIILNHTEEDRSGAISRLMEKYPDTTVISTVSGLKNIKEQLNKEFKQMLAKSNMVLKLDEENSLKFLITHNINWPDSMMTYHMEQKILFSCDAFSDVGGMYEYYKKNLSSFSEYVYSSVKMLKNIDVEKICPANGKNIDNPEKAFEDYLIWSQPYEIKEKNVCVVYYSKTKHTEKMVKRAKKLMENEIKCSAFDVMSEDKELILDAIYKADGVIFATPTENRNIPYEMSSVIMSLDHFKLKKQIFASFGSYGWSGEATNLVYSYLRARHFETYSAPFRWIFSEDGETLESFDKYIKSFYEKVINI